MAKTQAAVRVRPLYDRVLVRQLDPAEQVRGGFPEQAEATREKAEKATSEIKSAISRVWMFSEIANVHATEGENAAAWAAFDNGHRVAQELDNPWGRARAFGKLAATLINLVDPGKISP